jgi:hypothetical protein
VGAIDPFGLVKWFGQSRSFTWLPYSRDEYELESECKCGYKTRMTVIVDSIGPSRGAYAIKSANEFEDHFACPTPMAFVGPALTVGGAVAIRFGVSYSRTQIGAARSSGGWSPVEGLGAGFGASVGQARIENVRREDCQCVQK